MRYLVGVDIGTQSIKTSVYSEVGRLLASASREARHIHPEPGAVEEDPEFQFASVCSAIRECIATAGVDNNDVRAVGIAGQMAGVIGVDREGHAVTPYDSWLDRRCSPYIAAMQESAGDAILAVTGGAPSFNHGPKKLWWKNERPRVFEKIAKFVQPSAYCGMRMCGLGAEDAFIDPTYLHFTGFGDNALQCWNEDLCDSFAFPADKLPRIVGSHEVVGGLAKAMVETTGLREGTPVVAGCGDSAASFLSCGATQPGICVDIAGTASVFAATVDSFCPDRQKILGCGRSATPGLWHPYAYINGGGKNLSWFKDEFGGGCSFKQLDAAVAEIVLNRDLPYFVPHLGGRVSPGWPNLRGSWAGLSWDHGLTECYWAILESVALEFSIYQETLQANFQEHDLLDLRVTGGGQHSAYWNQLKANVLEVPVAAIRDGGGAAMGAAMLAGIGAGLGESIEDMADEWVSLAPPVEPEKKHGAFFAERKHRYRELVEVMNDWHN